MCVCVRVSVCVCVCVCLCVCVCVCVYKVRQRMADALIHSVKRELHKAQLAHNKARKEAAERRALARERVRKVSRWVGMCLFAWFTDDSDGPPRVFVLCPLFMMALIGACVRACVRAWVRACLHM